MRSPKMKKILVKVLKGSEWKWVHFCYVSNRLYGEFFKWAKCDTVDFTTFLSEWIQGDFKIKMPISTYDELQQLRYLVNKRYSEEYPELYALTKEENPIINGWVRLWVSQHMRIEISSRKEGYYE